MSTETAAPATRSAEHDAALALLAQEAKTLAPRTGGDEKRTEYVESLRAIWPAVVNAPSTLALEQGIRNLAEQVKGMRREWAAEDAAQAEEPAAPSRRAEAPEGMHRYGGMIWKVQRSPESGRVYAKVLEESPERASGWGFTYVPGGIRNLHEGTLLTLEEAKEFGALYGTCCVCGRTLTDEESIEAGIGPVCAAKF